MKPKACGGETGDRSLLTAVQAGADQDSVSREQLSSRQSEYFGL